MSASVIGRGAGRRFQLDDRLAAAGDDDTLALQSAVDQLRQLVLGLATL
jgi:hypothetical protein